MVLSLASLRRLPTSLVLLLPGRNYYKRFVSEYGTVRALMHPESGLSGIDMCQAAGVFQYARTDPCVNEPVSFSFLSGEW